MDHHTEPADARPMNRGERRAYSRALDERMRDELRAARRDAHANT